MPRKERAVSIISAKARLPATAISAGPVNVAEEGRNTTITPTKPMRIAVQRRAPTFSPSTSGESAAT